ncbi:hypothetical protein ACOME3_005149 [Neoechinorhynchus agilis]
MLQQIQLITLLLIVVFLASTNTLTCYECYTEPNTNCKNTADFDEVECLPNITQHCWKGVIGTILYRGCASGLCQGRVPLHDATFTRIYDGIPSRYIMENYCCKTDLCNGAGVNSRSVGILLFTLLLIVGFLLFLN